MEKIRLRTSYTLSFFCSAALLALTPLSHAAGASPSKWSGAVIFANNNKISSGVPVSNCHIITNEHAVRGNNKVLVRIAGRRYPADVISIDTVSDLSLLRLATCPIKSYAKVSHTRPVKGDHLTSIYYKAGPFFNKIMKSSGKFLGYLNVVTEENKNMHSMLIDDSRPRKGSSGGGVATKNGLVSVIFGVSNRNNKIQTFAVDYVSLTNFLRKNDIQLRRPEIRPPLFSSNRKGRHS